MRRGTVPVKLIDRCIVHGGQTRLDSHGLPPLLWNAHNQPVHLEADLSHLLWADLNLGCGSLAHHPNSERELADLFEHWHGRNSKSLCLHLQSLLRQARKAKLA